MRLIGKCSEFGGPDDQGMNGGKDDLDGKEDTGLAFYEPHEADTRPDLFNAADRSVKTWRRLKIDSFYIALNLPLGVDRAWVQGSLWDVMNASNGKVVRAWIVDRGPSARGRVVDCSRGVLRAIGAKTDDVLIVEEVIQ